MLITPVTGEGLFGIILYELYIQLDNYVQTSSLHLQNLFHMDIYNYT